MDKKSLRNVFAVLAQISLLICAPFISTTLASNLDGEVAQSDDKGGLSELVDPNSSLTFEQTVDQLKSAINDVETKTVKSLPKDGPELAELLQLAQFETAKCTETYFRQLVEWRQLFGDQTPLARYIKKVITAQRRFCEQYLANQTRLKIESFDVETRAHFDLFLERDQIGQDFYVSTDSAITKLRSMVSESSGEHTSDEVSIELGQKYLAACKEIVAKFELLVPIKKNHDIFARLPMRPDRYFRAYDFCRHLINFEFTNELSKMLFLDVRSRNIIQRFGQILDQFGNKKVVQQNDIKHTNTQLIPRAAVKYAQEFVRDHQSQKESNHNQRIKDRPAKYKFELGDNPLKQAVDHLKQACTTSLDWVENLLWLRRHNLEGLKPDKMTNKARTYLNLFKSCQTLIEIQTDVVIDHGLTEEEKKQILEEERRRNHPFNHLLRFFFNKR